MRSSIPFPIQTPTVVDKGPICPHVRLDSTSASQQFSKLKIEPPVCTSALDLDATMTTDSYNIWEQRFPGPKFWMRYVIQNVTMTSWSNTEPLPMNYLPYGLW